MTTAETILLQLSTEQVTPESIVDRLPAEIAAALGQPAIVVAAFLCDLEKAGLATSHALGDPALGKKLVTWRITETGRARAAALTAPADEPSSPSPNHSHPTNHHHACQ